MKRPFVIGGGIVLLIGAAALAWDRVRTSPDSEAVPLVADASDAQQVARGRAIYGKHCASCHGETLQGEAEWRVRKANGRLPAPPHDASGHTWHHTDDVLFRLTKYGPTALVGGDYQSDMPAYDGVLRDGEIVAVLAYIKSTWPQEIGARHDAMNAANARRMQQRNPRE